MLSEFFYPSRRLGISSPREVRCISSARRAVSHHASACILLRLDDIQRLPPLMICNSYGIDDIHAFGVMGMRKRIDTPPLLCYTKSRKTVEILPNSILFHDTIQILIRKELKNEKNFLFLLCHIILLYVMQL